MAGPSVGSPAAASRGRVQRINTSIAARYGSIVVPPCAALLAVIGAGILAAPDRYTTGAYRVAFQICPAYVGAAVFVAAGLAVLLRPRSWSLAALVAVHVTWALIVAAAAFTQPDVTPTAPAYPAAVAIILFQAIAGPPAASRP